MRMVAAFFLVAATSGCWRDADAVAGEYQAAYEAAHPEDVILADGFDADADSAPGTDAALEVADALDALDAVDLCKNVSCSDGNPCTDDNCADGTCSHSANLLGCDDGNACTSGDTCADGKCSGKTVTCDDSNGCTSDSCDGKIGCVFAPISVTCTDGDACTSADVCAGGKCGGSKITCSDGNLCTDDSCDVKTGCVYTNNTSTCDDGEICTTEDVCTGGKCSGSAVACVDNNPCTDEACVQGKGCVFTGNSAICDDNDVCTSGDVCGNKLCAGSAINCDDGNVCTSDSCKNPGGCAHVSASGSCDDGDPCTIPDACTDSVCVGSSDGFGVRVFTGPDKDAVWVGTNTLLGGTSGMNWALWTVNPDGSIGTRRIGSAGGYPQEIVPWSGGTWLIGDYSGGWFGDDGTSGTAEMGTVAQVVGAAALGNDMLLVGTQGPGEVLRAWVGVANVKTGSNPSLTITSQWEDSGNQLSTIMDFLPTTNGFLGIGWIDKAKSTDYFFVRIDSTGSVIGTSSAHWAAGIHTPISAIAQPDGGALILGLADTVTPTNLELVKINQNQVVQWHRPVDDVEWQNAKLIAAPTGAYVIGELSIDPPTVAVLRVDGAGNLVWKFQLPQGMDWIDPVLTAGIPLSEGRFRAFGWIYGGATGDSDILQVTLDAFGSPTCTTGTCNSASPPVTDDGNACTLDSCDPKSGVIHVKVADGSWCDDGVACTTVDTCKSGNCQGSPRLFSKSYSGRTLYGMTAVDFGGYALCGSEDSTSSWYITWVDGAGNTILDKKVVGLGTGAGRGCAQAVDDSVWQAGGGASDGAHARRIDLGTGNVSEFVYGGKVFTGIVPYPTGGVLALGSNQPGPRMTRLGFSGDVVWDWTVSGTGNADNANGAVVLDDGTIVVVGELHSSAGNAKPFAYGVDSAGKTIWTQLFPSVSVGKLAGIVIDPGGSPRGLGGSGTGVSAQPWIVRLGASTGSIEESLNPPGPPGTVWYDAAFLPTTGSDPSQQGVVLVGTSGNQALYARVNAAAFAGKPETPSGSQGSSPIFRRALLDPSGDVLVAGTTTSGQLLRMDEWFHSSCATSGVCVSLVASACNDSNVCTNEDCDSKTGCKFLNAPDNAPCAGNGKCMSGVCK